MNLDEETFLTAYLDGELDPGQRERVATALLSDPKLCEDFRDLTAIRDLVSGLSRPAAAVDVSALTVAAIRRRAAGPLARVIGVTAASWTSRAVALASAAAALVATASVGGLWSGPDSPDRPNVAHARPVPPGQAAVRRADDLPPGPVLSLAEPGEPASDPRPLVPGLDERVRERDHQRVRSLLDSPNLRKIFFVTDVVGGDRGRQVFDILEKKIPRRNPIYGRFTVNLGIVNDPDYPGEATVFAVVMDDSELNQLRTRLKEAFPDTVNEADPRPELVTELSEVGQVAVFPGTLVAGLLERPDLPNPALKADHRNRESVSRFMPETQGIEPLPAPDALDGPGPEPDRVQSRLVRRNRRGARNAGVPPAGDGQPESSVVLVWVANPRWDVSGVR